MAPESPATTLAPAPARPLSPTPDRGPATEDALSAAQCSRTTVVAPLTPAAPAADAPQAERAANAAVSSLIAINASESSASALPLSLARAEPVVDSPSPPSSQSDDGAATSDEMEGLEVISSVKSRVLSQRRLITSPEALAQWEEHKATRCLPDSLQRWEDEGAPHEAAAAAYEDAYTRYRSRGYDHLKAHCMAVSVARCPQAWGVTVGKVAPEGLRVR